MSPCGLWFHKVNVEVNPNGPPSEGKPPSTLSLSHAKDSLMASQNKDGDLVPIHPGETH